MSTKDLTITKRVKWMISVIAESFKIKESIVEVIKISYNLYLKKIFYSNFNFIFLI
jgi:hypothetical protein